MCDRSLSKSKTIGIIVAIAIFPLLVNQAFAQVIDDEWQLREQPFASGTPSCNFSFSSSPFERLVTSMSPNSGFGFCHVFKVFDKSDIINKNLDVTWAGTVGAVSSMRIYVLDGSYDRDVVGDFPANSNQDGFTIALKGAGLLHQFNRTATFATLTTDSINLTLAGSTEPQITVAVSIRDSNVGASSFMDITEIAIVDVGKWIWDSTATVTMAVTGTNNDKGVTNAGFVILPLQVDDVWELKEQQVLGGFPSGCTFTNATNLNADIDTAGLSHCIVFKVFEKSDLINRILNVTWAGSFVGLGLDNDITVFDGFYRSTVTSDFPLNVGSIGFTDGITGLKGAGVLHTIGRGSPYTTTTDSITMTLAGSTEPQVTVALKIRDGSGANSVHMDIDEILISNIGRWAWNTSTNVTNIVTGTNFDSGLASAFFVDLADVTPPVITILGDNPILHLQNTAYTDAGATALDNVDGDITSDIVTVSNVNTSVVAFYQVTYNVDDRNLNSATEAVRTVQVVAVMPVFGGGGGRVSASPSGVGGVGVGVSQLSDLEPLIDPRIQPVAEPKTVDEVFDIFARLNDLFAPTQPLTQEVPVEGFEDVPEMIVSPDAETAPPPIRESFIDQIASFFARLFG